MHVCFCTIVGVMAQDLLTTRQVAARLRVDVSTISRRVSAGKLTPAVTLASGHMLFSAADIDALVEAADLRAARDPYARPA